MDVGPIHTGKDGALGLMKSVTPTRTRTARWVL